MPRQPVESLPVPPDDKPRLSYQEARVVDLLFVIRDADGTVSVREVSELSEEERQPFDAMVEDLAGLFTVNERPREV